MSEVKQKSEKKIKKKVLRLFVKIAVIVLIFIILFGFIFGLKRIKGLDMYPNIKQGDLIMYFRLDQRYNDGDAIVVNRNGKDYIMRIVATEGETVKINDNKILVNNLVEINESFYKTEADTESSIKYPYKVEKGKYFVVFDYRLHKDDSRSFGTISKNDIKGKVIARLQIRNV